MTGHLVFGTLHTINAMKTVDRAIEMFPANQQAQVRSTLSDALKAVALPAVEVHISDVSRREDFRQISYAGKACVKTYMGLGFEGYRQAILYLKALLGGRISE